MALMHSTMVGPVGRRAVVLLITAPLTPASAPNRAARPIITPSRSVHWRAAAAGATTMALISTTPTVCSPNTMATTSRVINNTSRTRIGKPRLAPNSGSKVSNLNSFQKINIASSARAPSPAIVTTSRSRRAAACPKRNLSSPAWAALGIFWIKVKSTKPKPKKTASTRPRALSSLTRVVLMMLITSRVPIQPAATAPKINTNGALLPVSRKARAMPGNAA